MDGWFRKSTANNIDVYRDRIPWQRQVDAVVRDGLLSRVQSQEECVGVPTIDQVRTRELPFLLGIRRRQSRAVFSVEMQSANCYYHLRTAHSTTGHFECVAVAGWLQILKYSGRCANVQDAGNTAASGSKVPRAS